MVVKLSVSGIKGAKNTQAIIERQPSKTKEFIKLKLNKIILAMNDRYSIGIFLLPYLSPNPAKKGLEMIFNKTEREIIRAIYRESNPFEESHKGQNGAFIPITKNIEK